ncbi:unnamed protein product [Citrullus colocynthis]|uniref:Uncharacterized protein n=1 Tax=Citrullus colocynthis TaxID=252529 RepID=A0ABP0Z6F9_9ROSI
MIDTPPVAVVHRSPVAGIRRSQVSTLFELDSSGCDLFLPCFGLNLGFVEFSLLSSSELEEFSSVCSIGTSKPIVTSAQGFAREKGFDCANFEVLNHNIGNG